MSNNNNGNGFFGAIQHSVNSFIYSLTTNDRYASYDSPYRNAGSNRLSGSGLPSSNNNSTVSLVDNSTSNRSSTSNTRPFAYRPGLRSVMQNNASGDLQLQDYINGEPPLPSIDSIWERLENFLEREYPELYDNLGEGATSADLNELENDLECTLPSDVRESFQIHDGQENKSAGLIFGLTLLEAEYVSEESDIWKKVCKKLERKQAVQDKKQYENQQGSPSSSNSKGSRELPVNRRPIDYISMQKSVPEGAIQTLYAHPQWIPLAKDYGGNNIAVDLAPGPNGRWGQIILFGRDFDTKYVVANSWTEFLLNVVEDFEEGKFIIDPVNESIAFYENNRAVDYFRVLVHRTVAPLRKAAIDKKAEAIAKTTALGSKNSSKVDLPKETLVTPQSSSTNLTKKAIPDEHEIKLDDEEEEEDEEEAETEGSTTVGNDATEIAIEQKEEPIEVKEDEVEEQEKPAQESKDEVEDVKEKLEDVVL